MDKMKIPWMIFKEIVVFFRDYRSFILLFLTPVVIAGSIGILYMNSQPSDIRVILCTPGERTNLYYTVRHSMLDSEMFWIFEEQGNCKEIISNRIKSADVRMGVIVNSEPFYDISEYNNSIEVIYDNSKPIGLVIQSHLSLITNQISKEIINSAIGLARDEIETTVDDVDENIVKMSLYMQQLKGLRNDVAVIRNNVVSIRQEVQQLNTLLNNIDNSITNLDNSINDLNNIENNIQNAENQLDFILESLDEMNLTLEEKNDIRNSILVVYPTLSQAKSTVTNAKTTVVNSRNQLQSIRNQINLQGTVSTLESIESELDSILIEFDSIISLIEASINDITSMKNYLSEKISEVPSQYQDPIKTEITGFFGNKNYINFMFPTIIITILMWMSVFLSSIAFIKQRNQGILKRISISPTGTSLIILEKIFVYTIISLLFLPLILILGIFVFGVEINLFNLIPIIFIYTIASMLFVLQGLTIGSVTKSENAATLSSLMLVVPLMFISGTFFPEESLPRLVKFFTPSMPINISINLIEGFFFYEFSLQHIFIKLGRLFMYLLVYGFIAWMFLTKNIKK